MNAHLIDVLSQPFIERLGWTLLHAFWQGGVVAVLLKITLRQLHQSTHRHAACLGALFITLACSTATFRLVTVSAGHAYPPSALPAESQLGAGTRVLGAQAVASPGKLIGLEQGVEIALKPYLPWLTGVWMLGVALLSLSQLLAWTRVRRWRARHCHPASANLEKMLHRLRLDFGICRPVFLEECGCLSTPLLLGWFKPVIILPASVVTGLSRELIEAILAHELAHLRRGDVLVLLFQRVMGTLFFFHPAVWWINRRLGVEREHCCDDLAVARGTVRETLATALGRLALESSAFSVPQKLAATGHKPVLERMRRLLSSSGAKEGFTSWALVVCSTLALAAMLAFILVNWRQSKPPPPGMAAPTNSKFFAMGKVIAPEFFENDWKTTLDSEARAQYRVTQIEFLESRELHRRTLERMRRGRPESKELPVQVHAFRVKETAIIEVTVSGDDQDYAKTFLNTLLDEYVAFRMELIEKSLGFTVNRVIDEVLTRQKIIRAKWELVAKANQDALKAPDSKELEVTRAMVKMDYDRAKEDYDHWKETLDRINRSRVRGVDAVPTFERSEKR